MFWNECYLFSWWSIFNKELDAKHNDQKSLNMEKSLFYAVCDMFAQLWYVL